MDIGLIKPVEILVLKLYFNKLITNNLGIIEIEYRRNFQYSEIPDKEKM